MFYGDNLLELADLLENTNTPLSLLSLKQIPETSKFATLDLTLYLLLQDNLFVSACQKLIAYYLLYEHSLSSEEKSPYLQFFVHVAKNEVSVETWERNFCHLLLTRLPDDVLQKPATEILECMNQLKALELVNTKIIDEHKNIAHEESQEDDKFSLIFLLDGNAPRRSNLYSKLREEKIESGTFGSHIHRLDFPLMPYPLEEYSWMYTITQISPFESLGFRNIWFELDPQIRFEKEDVELFNLALTESLPNEELIKIVKKMRMSDQFLKKVDVSPEIIPQLIQNNPKLAVQTVVQLIQQQLKSEFQDSIKLSPYWMALANSKLNLFSLEVVLSLSMTVHFPIEYLYIYISNCIRTCELETKDQRQLVSVFCLFLQTLIRKNLLKASDIGLELEKFCISFSKEREACNLYRMIKKSDAQN